MYSLLFSSFCGNVLSIGSIFMVLVLFWKGKPIFFYLFMFYMHVSAVWYAPTHFQLCFGDYCMNIYPRKSMSLTGSHLGIYLETQTICTFRNPLPFFGENMIFMIPFCPKHSLVCLKSYLRVKSGCHLSFF